MADGGQKDTSGVAFFFANMLLFINKEIVMQKRFCSCGYMVFVRYLCSNGKWRPEVIVQDREGRRGVGMTRCPICGSALSIHSLR